MIKREALIQPHGGDIYGKRIELDFSVNINPCAGNLKEIKDAARNGLDGAFRYPDPCCRELRLEISKLEGVLSEQIICGNGASELFMAIAHALKPHKALVLAPCYSGYETALKAVPDCQVCQYELKESEGFVPDDSLLDAVKTDVDIVFIADPNNPTGRLMDSGLLKKLIEKCKEAGAYLIIDACFYPLAEHAENKDEQNNIMPDQAQSTLNNSPIKYRGNRISNRDNAGESNRMYSPDDAGESNRICSPDDAGGSNRICSPDDAGVGNGIYNPDNEGESEKKLSGEHIRHGFNESHVIQVKAFTKTVAIPGLRLGYLMSSNEKLLNRIRQHIPEWNVSTVAQQAGIAAAKLFRETNFLKDSVEYIRKEREWLSEKLKELELTVYESDVNYILCKSKILLYDSLLKKSILVRSCESFYGLGPEYIRLAVRTHDENERIIGQIEELLSEK